MTNTLAGPSQATVQTLAAEVRVLMVGSRQVTLSVYRQLDTVRPDAIEPFGRVNTGRTVSVWDGWSRYEKQEVAIEVVGRIRSGYTGAGALARAYIQKSGKEPYAEWSALPLIVLAGLR
jgi:hypothetical protein